MSHGGRWSCVEFCGDHYKWGNHRTQISDFLGLGGAPETKERNSAHKKEGAEKGGKMIQKTKCPECGSVTKECCVRHILAGRPAPESSELQRLLYKNAYGAGLTIAEWNRARYLIVNPEFSEKFCRICKTEKSIFDTELCQEHALRALDPFDSNVFK